MIINDIVSTVVERFNTTEEIEKVVTKLDVWINNGANIDNTLLTPNEIQQLTTADDNNQTSVLSKPEIILNLNKLKSALKLTPVLEIVCPFPVDQAFKVEVIKIVKPSINGSFVAKFSTNESLIAGAQINFKGKFKDYSLIKQLEGGKERIFGTALKEN